MAHAISALLSKLQENKTILRERRPQTTAFYEIPSSGL
jgi:hypothetical protein